VVGADTVDEGWVRTCLGERAFDVRDERGEGDEKDDASRTTMGRRGVGEVVEMQLRKALARIKQDRLSEAEAWGHAEEPEGRLRFESLDAWKAGRDGYLGDEAELGMGYKGKGRARCLGASRVADVTRRPALRTALTV
jgi:hypothetical protein